MYKISEARLIVPSAPFASAHFNRLVTFELEDRITRDFGGFTRIHGFGGWRVDDKGEQEREDVFIYDIATEDSQANVVALRHLANQVRKDLNQLSVYLRLPDGSVEFIEGERPTVEAVGHIEPMLDEPDSYVDGAVG